MSLKTVQSLRDMYQADWQELASEQATWHWEGNDLRIGITYYLTQKLPEFQYITSVRGVLLCGAEVLLLTNKDGIQHIVPGGRLDNDETLMEGLAREMLEETGYTFTEPQLIAVIHHQHLTSKPEGYPYSSSEFLQIVY